MKKTFLLFSFVALAHIGMYAQSGWVKQTSGTNRNLQSVFFTSADTGYAVGQDFEGPMGCDCSWGLILKTVNGGTSWTHQSYPATPMSATQLSLNSVFFINADTGYAVGTSGTIIKTTNKGTTWTPLTSGTSKNLSSVYFIGNTGYAAGLNGTIIKTTDGGATWVPQTTGTTYGLNSVYFIHDTGYVVGQNGTILKTINGGADWVKQTSGAAAVLQSVFFSDKNTGYVVGSQTDPPAGCECTWGEVLKTTDGGATWGKLYISPYGWSSYTSFHSVYFVNTDTGFVVGSQILKTTDGGSSWIVVKIGGSGTDELNSVFFISNNIGYAVGKNGMIIKTTNGGEPGLYFKTQPVNKYVARDSSTSFTALAGGIYPITYQWYKDDVKINSATDSILKINNAQDTDNGFYYCVIKNVSDSLVSNKARLHITSINPTPPVITKQPADLTVWEGNMATFRVSAIGLPAFIYQWYFADGSPVAYGYDSTLTFLASLTDNNKKYYCMITNPIGSVNSDTVTLTVQKKIALSDKTESSVIVYPNPATEQITIETTCGGPVELQLLNMQGVVVLNKKEENATGQIQLLLPKEMNKGVYCLVVKCGENVVSKKIVIE